MSFPRSSGVLLHPTSLPGPHGIGDFGPTAFAFADFLAEAGQSIWQVLPLGPTGYGDSPYQCFSAFAGNPLLINLDKATAETQQQFQKGNGRNGHSGRRGPAPSPAGMEQTFSSSPDAVEYERANRTKMQALNEVFEIFQKSAMPELRQEFEQFKKGNPWVPEYALFRALKDRFGGVAWPNWERPFASRQPQALESARRQLTCQIARHEYFQFIFFQQWAGLKDYCHGKGIRIMGDLPIYVAHDSADVWSHPEYFCLAPDGGAEKVAGVPPDYFSATGQLWGNPIYRWDRMAADGYSWWIERFRGAFRLFDMVRLDHFRGFEAYWEVPGREHTAQNGKWVKGPGGALFEAVQAKLGKLPIVAENLGVITPEVESIRERFGFPGMAILQFAFGNDPQGPDFRPHNYPRNRVAYTGTHDNDTVMGWWVSEPGMGSIRSAKDICKERAFARAYLNFDNDEVNWVFIRALMASVADTVIFPLQDVLGLGSEARMNTPGTATGNWRWRVHAEMIKPEIASRLRELVRLYDRVSAMTLSS